MTPSRMTSSTSDRLKKPRIRRIRGKVRKRTEREQPKEEPKPTTHRGNDAIEGEKTEDELETANSDKSENRSEEAESVRMLDSDTLNQPGPSRREGSRRGANTVTGPCEQTSRPKGSKRAESNRSRSASKA